MRRREHEFLLRVSPLTLFSFLDNDTLQVWSSWTLTGAEEEPGRHAEEAATQSLAELACTCSEEWGVQACQKVHDDDEIQRQGSCDVVQACHYLSNTR